jgi:hypothetical protein
MAKKMKAILKRMTIKEMSVIIMKPILMNNNNVIIMNEIMKMREENDIFRNEIIIM